VKLSTADIINLIHQIQDSPTPPPETTYLNMLSEIELKIKSANDDVTSIDKRLTQLKDILAVLLDQSKLKD
jgi:hypothetical protein